MAAKKFDFVLLAAGEGTRLFPLTATYPKAMVRVLEKPVLEWMIEAVAPFANRIVVVVGHKKERLFEYLRDNERTSSTKGRAAIEFVEQSERRGTGHALLQAEKAVRGDFFVANADLFFAPSFVPLAVKHAARGYLSMAKPVDRNAFQYGVFETKGERITRVAEKPVGQQAGLIYAGLSFLPHSTFTVLKKLRLSPRGEFELTDALSALAATEDLRAVSFTDFLTDLSAYWNYLDANTYAVQNLLQPKVLGEVEEGVALKNAKLFVGKNAVVKAGTRIEGPAYIGDNTTIGPNAFLRGGVVIERDCHVGTTEVKASVVLRESSIPHLSYVGDSVIGEDVNVGGGTIFANLRFDEENVRVNLNGKTYDSGRRKLGAAVGAGTRVGIQASINCGAVIPPNSRVLPGTFYK